VTALSIVSTACAGSDDAASSTTGPGFTLPSIDGGVNVSVGTTAPPTVATTPATEPTTPVTEATQPPTTTTTLAPTTTTTEPLSVQELLLRGDGIGSARFGADPDGVIDYVASILGGNTGDTGWVDPYTFADCSPASVARKVDWGVLSLLFSDLSSYADGRRHFIGWEYGRVGQIGDEPIGLRTPGGISLGSRVVDLLAEFPDASINEGEADLSSPPNFYVSNFFRGLLTGTTDEDVITVIFGGYGCGE
jgi:hypothetical protein